MLRVLCALLLVLCATFPANAQTNPVPANQSFDLGWSHSGVGSPTGFTCEVNGKVVATVAPAARTCTIQGLAAGTYTLTVTAVNAFGSGTSDPLTATAGVPPDKPTNLQITVKVAVMPDGSVTLLAANVESSK